MAVASKTKGPAKAKSGPKAKAVTIGSAKALPGTVAFGAIPVTKLAGGNPAEIPVAIINGARPGKVLWIDGAIHGAGPEGPLCCQHLLREVDPKTLEGTIDLVPVINVAALEAASRGNPLDTFSYDGNRIYPGRPNGYLTKRIVDAHSQWMRKVADMEILIHSGGGHSYPLRRFSSTCAPNWLNGVPRWGRVEAA